MDEFEFTGLLAKLVGRLIFALGCGALGFVVWFFPWGRHYHLSTMSYNFHDSSVVGIIGAAIGLICGGWPLRQFRRKWWP